MLIVKPLVNTSRRCLFVLAIALAATVPAYPQGHVVPDAPKIAPPPRDFKAPHAGAIPEFGVVGEPDTARTYAPFKGMRVGMPLTDVITLCGLPDGDWGNIGGPTSHILIWDLKDGSWVSIKSDGLQVVEDIGRGYPIKVKRRLAP